MNKNTVFNSEQNTNKDCMISVILPCWNVEAYIEKCMKCLNEQTYTQIEIIAVDDGSTDGTLAKLREYESEKCIVIHIENRGVSQARNEGITHANGEYLYFMDPDDWIDSRCLETIYNNCVETGADAVQFCYHSVDETGAQGWEWNDENKKEIYCGNEIIKELLPRYIGFSTKSLMYYGTNHFYEKTDIGVVWRWLFRKDIIKSNNIEFPSNIKLGEDRFFLCEYLIHAKTVSFMKEYLYTYLIRKNGGLIRNMKDSKIILNHKVEALHERERIRDIILENKKIDISDTFAGSIVLSVLQLAVQLSSISLKQQIQGLHAYIGQDSVKKAIMKVPTRNMPLKLKIPIFLMKWKMYDLLGLSVFACIKSGIIKANPW